MIRNFNDRYDEGGKTYLNTIDRQFLEEKKKSRKTSKSSSLSGSDSGFSGSDSEVEEKDMSAKKAKIDNKEGSHE